MNRLWCVEFECSGEPGFVEYVVAGEIEGAAAVVRAKYEPRWNVDIQKVELIASRLLEMPEAEGREGEGEGACDADGRQPEKGRIFSGDRSRDVWAAIHRAETIDQLRHALYLVCCRTQELEDDK